MKRLKEGQKLRTSGRDTGRFRGGLLRQIQSSEKSRLKLRNELYLQLGEEDIHLLFDHSSSVGTVWDSEGTEN